MPFNQALRNSDFVITAALALPETATAADVTDRVLALRGVVDAVQVDDDRNADGSIDPLAVAALALAERVDPVLQLSCRDRNRVALRSVLRGAAALGVSSLIVTRGEKIPEEMRGKVKGVFDTTAAQLMELACREGREAGAGLGDGFCIGGLAPVIRPKAGWMADQVDRKVAAGMNFLQTRPCLNTGILAAWLRRLVELGIPRKVAVIVDVPLVTSAEAARRIQDEHPATRIPANLVNRIVSATDPLAEGATVCGEVIAAARTMPGVSGANIVGSPDPGLTALAIERSRAGA